MLLFRAFASCGFNALTFVLCTLARDFFFTLAQDESDVYVIDLKR